MTTMPTKRHAPVSLAKPALVAASLLLATGCSLYKANKAFEAGRFEDAVRAYQDILSADPENVKARIGYKRSATRAAELHLEQAREAERRKDGGRVYQEVRRALVLDPGNALATEWLTNLELAAQEQKRTEESLDAQREQVESQQPLMLNPRSLEGMDLNFSRRTSLRDILANLGRASGVNIILHNSFQDANISADLRGLSFQRILDTLMLQSQLFYKVLDTNTIMVFKDTPTNRTEHENKLLKTFFLSNASPDDLRSIFTSLMPQMKVFVDKRLNAIIVNAKPTELSVATRIVNQLDKAQAEVMIYLELLEVTENSMEQVGLLPVLGVSDGLGGGSGIYRLGATVDNTGGVNQNKGGIKISRNDVRFLFPNLALDALKSSGDARLVASPNVRVLTGKTGEVDIGEKISTTQSSIGFANNASSSTSTTTSSAYSAYGATQTQYSYENAGVKIKITPRVHFNEDITLEIDSEITTLKSGSTPGRPDFGTRKIKTHARLQNGETAAFGGLLKDEEQKSLQGIWGVSDLPFIGKLLGNNYKKRAKTDVILTVRAVLVRKPDLRREDFEAFDPDLARAKAGPFAPKAAPEAKTLVPKAEPKPGPKTDPKAAPAEAQPAASTPAGTPAKEPKEEKTPEAKEAAPSPASDSELVLFLSPTDARISKGDRIQLTLLVSGGRGVSSGSFELVPDPKLKLTGAVAGDFLLGEGGSLQVTPGTNGAMKISFKRSSSETDSGTLAVVDVEGLGQGSGVVQVMNGRYMAGANPISGRVLGSLITVE
jgi:type II secretory pathway component GspD/PulD (secretin)